ncbi:MAG: hypothetical protein ACTHOD_01345 [Motilibacteraceae bacterium]
MERRRLVLATAVAALSGSLALTACGGGSASGPGGSGGKSGAKSGGTLTVLSQSQQLQHLDPQRVYTGEDLAFLNAYTTRTLTAYKAVPGAPATSWCRTWPRTPARRATAAGPGRSPSATARPGRTGRP